MRWKWILNVALVLIGGSIFLAYLIVSSYHFNELKPRISKAVKDITKRVRTVAETRTAYVASPTAKEDIARLIKELESEMKTAARNLEFEKAALLRDRIIELRKD